MSAPECRKTCGAFSPRNVRCRVRRRVRQARGRALKSTNKPPPNARLDVCHHTSIYLKHFLQASSFASSVLLMQPVGPSDVQQHALGE